MTVFRYNNEVFPLSEAKWRVMERWWVLGALDMWALCVSVLVLCAAQYGSTISCYECNSATDSQCSEGILPEVLRRNCSDHDRGVTHTLCRKIIQHVDYGVNGRQPESRIIRSCGWDESRYKGKCYHRSGYGGRQEVCSCLTDYCNSGDHSIISTTLLIMAPTIAAAKLFSH